MRLALLLLTAVACAGCGAASAAHALPPSTSSDGKAVLHDAYDGRLDHAWTCASLRAAVSRLPDSTPIYTQLPMLVINAAATTCDAALARLHRGATEQQVQVALGTPTRAPRCWLYRWRPSPSSAVDGARICFSGRRASLVQVAVHG